MDEDNILVSRVKSGDKASLNILINKYRDVIANYASRFGSIMPVQAVNAEGMSLLIEAAERFNPSSGASFRTFLGNYLSSSNNTATTVVAVFTLKQGENYAKIHRAER